VAISTSTFLIILSLQPEPKLVADLEIKNYSQNMHWHEYYYFIELSGNIHNYGEIGCFASIYYIISDNRGWSMNDTIDLGWISGNGGIIYINELYEWPYTYNGQLANTTSPELEDYYFSYYG